VLKPSMVISGKGCARQAGVDEVAERTVRILKRTGSGGSRRHRLPVGRPERRAGDRAPQRHEPDVCRNLPWPLSFSYGRALQQPALKPGKAARPMRPPHKRHCCIVRA